MVGKVMFVLAALLLAGCTMASTADTDGGPEGPVSAGEGSELPDPFVVRSDEAGTSIVQHPHTVAEHTFVLKHPTWVHIQGIQEEQYPGHEGMRFVAYLDREVVIDFEVPGAVIDRELLLAPGFYEFYLGGNTPEVEGTTPVVTMEGTFRPFDAGTPDWRIPDNFSLEPTYYSGPARGTTHEFIGHVPSMFTLVLEMEHRADIVVELYEGDWADRGTKVLDWTGSHQDEIPTVHLSPGIHFLDVRVERPLDDPGLVEFTVNGTFSASASNTA